MAHGSHKPIGNLYYEYTNFCLFWKISVGWKVLYIHSTSCDCVVVSLQVLIKVRLHSGVHVCHVTNAVYYTVLAVYDNQMVTHIHH